MFRRRRSKVRKTAQAAARVTTNPAVSVAGATGAALLGAALIRRRQEARSSDPTR